MVGLVRGGGLAEQLKRRQDYVHAVPKQCRPHTHAVQVVSRELNRGCFQMAAWHLTHTM